MREASTPAASLSSCPAAAAAPVASASVARGGRQGCRVRLLKRSTAVQGALCNAQSETQLPRAGPLLPHGPPGVKECAVRIRAQIKTVVSSQTPAGVGRAM